MALKTIGLSFKNTEDDKRLHEWIYKHSNVSGFIKDILRAAMLSEDKQDVKVESKSNNLIDLGDF